MKPLIVSIILFIIHYQLFAQQHDVYSRNYTSEIVRAEQGLSQNSVLSIMQDSHGLMWFGTWDGLNRFNGLQFKIFRSDYSGATGQLPNHTINTIYEDHRGLFWIGTDNGLTRFNPATENYRNYFHNPNDTTSISNDTIKTIIADANKTIWIGTQNGLNKLADTSGKFVRYFHEPDNPHSLSDHRINDIFKDSNGNLWISTADGLNKRITGYDRFFRIMAGSDKNLHIIHNTVNCVEELQDKRIMVGAQGGLSVLKLSGDHIMDIHPENTNNQLKSEKITDICSDSKGKVWIATDGGGISFYYPDQNKIKALENIKGYRKLNEDYVNVIYEDQQNIIWIGYSWKGINKVVPSKFFFSHFNQSDGLLSNSVWSVAQIDKNRFFIGTDKGISLYNKNDDTFRPIQTEDGLSSDNIRAMTNDNNGNIWIGTLDKGLMKYDIKEQSFEYFGNKENDTFPMFYNNPVWAIQKDFRGKIWVGTFNGLFVFDPDSINQEKVKSYYHDPDSEGSLSSNIIYSLYEDDNQTMWVSTYNGGLNKYDRKNDHFLSYSYDADNPGSIPTNKVFSINQGQNGFLWIGTMGAGLSKMNPYTGKFSQFQEKDGLSNNVVYDVIQDHSGYLWLSTNNGLSRFDPKTKAFVNYDIRDGVQSYEFNMGASLKSKQGDIFFGGMNGFNVFHPSKIQQSKVDPDLVVSQIEVYNELLPGMFFDGDTINLSHDDNSLSLQFAALDYSNSVKLQYKYKMGKVSNEWIHTSSEKNIAEFTNLAPGTYTFYLMGTNSDGIWGKSPLMLTFVIEPAWYQTTFFRISTILLFFGLISWVVSMRVKRIKMNHNVEKQMFDLERKALRLQMNPHFIFNTLNSIQNFILTHNKTAAVSYLNKFSKVMRQVLYNSDKTFVPLTDEITMIKNYIELEQLRFNAAFDYSFYIDEQVEQELIAVPTMLIQPHVENAILHGINNLKERKGRLDIQFYAHTINTIKCIVDDNGIGRKASAELKETSGNIHNSKGFSITKQRLEQINHSFSESLSVWYEDKHDNAGNPNGTRVVIILPIKNVDD
ncbi:MAG: ligand-binding sensor domain-containing protein [Bacteroidales bacterium]